MEQTREYAILVTIYQDTNKATYRDEWRFESLEELAEWVRGEVAERALDAPFAPVGSLEPDQP